jgi:hypothetical protein
MIRSLDRWLPGYLASVLARSRRRSRPGHLCFCLADHFEPFRGGVGPEAGRAAVAKWVANYPGMAERFHDADGRSPRHTFFYPQEDYDEGCLEMLSSLCARGLGEVEVHLHHRNDTAEGLARKLTGFRDVLHDRHGLLGCDRGGACRYGFVHGNWALCNSRPDGDWCGVDHELAVLRRTGCYADFTFPSVPSPTQPRAVNAICRVQDSERGRRCFDRGERVAAGTSPAVDGLLLIQGPVALDWRRRKWGLAPRIENAALTGVNPPTARRVDLWVRQQIRVIGRLDWVFVKVHTHGCVEENAAALMGREAERAHGHLCSAYNDGTNWRLHYVTARELYNIIRAAEDGAAGDPGDFRDYEIMAPAAGRS